VCPLAFKTTAQQLEVDYDAEAADYTVGNQVH
jgi:hypothetical protein